MRNWRGNDAGAVFGRTYPRGARITPMKCVAAAPGMGADLFSGALRIRPAVRGVRPPPLSRLRPGGAGGRHGSRAPGAAAQRVMLTTVRGTGRAALWAVRALGSRQRVRRPS